MSEKKKRRDVFICDFPAPRNHIFDEIILSIYPNFRSHAALGRQVLEEFILCHLDEKQAKEKGLLAEYDSLERPKILLYAINKSEEIRRKEPSATTEVPAQTVRRRTGGARG